MLGRAGLYVSCRTHFERLGYSFLHLQRKSYQLELPPCSEEQIRQPKRHRQHQLHIDSNITLSKEQIREQITNHHVTCKSMVSSRKQSILYLSKCKSKKFSEWKDIRENSVFV